MTAEELREKPVLLELRLGGNEGQLQWLVRDELNYSKLEKMSAKDAVEYMLTDAAIQSIRTDAVIPSNKTELAGCMREFISKNPNYEIATETSDTMDCKTTGDGRVIEDQRTQPMIDHLTPLTTEDKIDILYQGMTIYTPIWI